MRSGARLRHIGERCDSAIETALPPAMHDTLMKVQEHLADPASRASARQGERPRCGVRQRAAGNVRSTLARHGTVDRRRSTGGDATRRASASLSLGARARGRHRRPARCSVCVGCPALSRQRARVVRCARVPNATVPVDRWSPYGPILRRRCYEPVQRPCRSTVSGTSACGAGGAHAGVDTARRERGSVRS